MRCLPSPAECAFSGQLSPCCVCECVFVCVPGFSNWEPHATHMSGDNAQARADIGEQWSSVWSPRDNAPIIRGCQKDSNWPRGQTSLCFCEWMRLKRMKCCPHFPKKQKKPKKQNQDRGASHVYRSEVREAGAPYLNIISLVEEHEID